jgi:2-polyprenyl-3-methyl-5-hydroxy-6-metoxy-1,4-benzoquinol methylase
MELKEIYHFKELPFNIGSNPTPDNGDLPNKLPFTLGIDSETGRLVQIPDIQVTKALNKAYQRGSLITGYMDEEGLGRQYADDFINFLISSSEMKAIPSSRILEIGCGTGYLLYRLKQMGASVLGVEPGPQGQMGRKEYGLKIIQDFFPSSRILGMFNIIIHYGVLEHVENPYLFLTSVKDYLAENGLVAIASPSCDSCIEFGDISMLLHEHWSYFTRQTFKRTIESSGFSVLNLQKAGFGGTWYALAQKSVTVAPTSSVQKENLGFMEEFLHNQKVLNKFTIETNKTVGFYCPARIVNTLFLALTHYDDFCPQIRFFDDNRLLHGQYYSCLPYPIESREQLFVNPVDILIITSWTFGKQIRKNLIKEQYKGEIITFEDFFSQPNKSK